MNSGFYSIATNQLNYIQSTTCHTEFESPSDEHMRHVVRTTLDELPTSMTMDVKNWYSQFFLLKHLWYPIKSQQTFENWESVFKAHERYVFHK